MITLSSRIAPIDARRSMRGGYTLIEVLVAAGASTVLMSGLAGALFVATQTLAPDSAASSDANRSALALAQLGNDLRHALRFHERTATAVMFDVPDRTGDSRPETLRYSWSGVADASLLYQFNGGTTSPLAEKVKHFAVTALTRNIPSEALDIAAASSVTYDGFTEGKATIDQQFVIIPAPAGSSLGKLLIAAVAVDKAQGDYIMAQGGWNRLARLNRSGELGLGVWWKIAGANEPAWHVFYWPGNEQAYGWIMRFSGAHPTRPINAYATHFQTSALPQSPAVTTTVANTLVLRIGGFDRDMIVVDSPGVASHSAITMDRSNTGLAAASGGAAYTTQAAAGAVAAATFVLTGSEEYATATIAIAPNNGN